MTDSALGMELECKLIAIVYTLSLNGDKNFLSLAPTCVMTVKDDDL